MVFSNLSQTKLNHNLEKKEMLRVGSLIPLLFTGDFCGFLSYIGCAKMFKNMKICF